MGVKVINNTKVAMHGSIPGTGVSYYIPVGGSFEFKDYKRVVEEDGKEVIVEQYTAAQLAQDVVDSYKRAIPSGLEVEEDLNFIAKPNKNGRYSTPKRVRDIYKELCK